VGTRNVDADGIRPAPEGVADEQWLGEVVVRALLANFFANRRLFEVVETPLTE
jgi:hypothetical protein